MKPSSLQLTFLGTGTGVPSAERGSPSLLLRLGPVNVLIDIGPGSLRQLARIGFPITTIDHILLTHLHPDHCADLAPFLFASKYPPYLKRQRPVRLIAGDAFGPFYERLQDLYGTWIEWPPGLLQITLLPPENPWQESLPHFTLESRPVSHTSSSLGYRLTLPKGKRLVFSGDSDYSAILVDLARKADCFVCECSFPEKKKVAGHLIPSLAGRIAREAQVKQLVLTHFYPECSGQDLIQPCAKEYDGPIILAEDFLTLTL
jgi:ribonuclease BN (tRNA processing enzyme)